MPVTTEERKGISNPAKVLLAYMRLTNKWDSNELSAEFGVPLRTIQRWKMECATSATDATHAISGASSEHGQSATRATSATDGAPLTPDMALARNVHSRAGANKEFPTEINITQSVSQSHASAQEPAGWQDLKTAFNGSTEAMLVDVQAFMGPLANRNDAVKWLSGTLSAYGGKRTAQAWTIITAKRAAGEPVANPLPLWAKTAGGLKADQQPGKPRLSRW